MRIPRLAALAALLLALLAPPVLAEDILRLEGPVTDTSGALAGREADVEAAIERTLDEHGAQVWVLFVGSTDGRTAEEYAFETASENSLGVGDALLLVAMVDRTDYIWLSDSLDAITDDELDAIITAELEPRLQDGEPAEAAIAAVEALGVAASSPVPTAAPVTEGPIVPGPTMTPGDGGGGTTDGDDGFPWGTLIGVALIGGGGYLAWRTWQRRRTPVTPGGAAAPAPVDAKTLAHQANALLIATDERIRDAAQETDFAEAQYGPEAVAAFRAAVAAARDELAAAFTIRQRLDDAEPEDEPTRIAMLQEVVARTTGAQERLDAETERIRQLRDLERDAPNTLVELPARIEAVEDRLDSVAATTARLQGYAPTVWSPIAGNLEEARKGIAGARTAVTVASAGVSGGDMGDVAVATRTALEGMTGATGLLDAIEALAEQVSEAERRLPEELAAAERDLADLTSTLTGRTVDGGADDRRRAAADALEAARAAALARPPDPIEAVRRATEAHRLADEGLVATRDAIAAAERLLAAADSSVRTASAEVDRAATFIASRRRGVGETARTRLAEAQRHLVEAVGLVRTEPARSIEVSRRAQALAQEAMGLAQDDFTDWDQGGPGWGQRSGTSGGDQTAAILGQILGGVIGGVIAGGGRSGGGWGGSPWGGGGRGRGGRW